MLGVIDPDLGQAWQERLDRFTRLVEGKSVDPVAELTLVEGDIAELESHWSFSADAFSDALGAEAYHEGRRQLSVP